MKRSAILILAAVLGSALAGCASTRTLEAGCATCIYHMQDVQGCELAVQVDGRAYLVKGVDMDDLGDAHASDGLCNTARQVKAKGKLDGDYYAAEGITLIP